MSRFLKIPNEAYTRRCLSQRFIRYNFYEPNVEFGILPEDPEKTELDFLQSVLRNMGPNSRMYGSAQELLENLKIYANFPGNDNFFDTKYEPYQNSPTFYYSLKDSDKYVAKPDLFVILQNIMFIISDTPGFSFLSILIGHLKLQEQRLGSNFEFVKCDESILEAFYNSMLRIVNMHKITDDEFEKTRAKYEQMSVDEILKDLKKLTPKSWDKNEDETMRRLTNFVTHASDSTQKSIIFAQLAAISVSCIRAVERVVDYDGEIYCLHHSISYFRKKITVRVFEDGKERFVMNKELFDAFIASGFECSPIGGDYCYTTAMRDVYREFKQYIQDIEFIRYPITRAKHRATPVKAPSIDGAESLVILAIDAFFEIFRYSIFRLKLLQLESKGFELLKQMIPVFLQLNDNSNTVYFIPLLMFDEFEKQYYQEINNSHSGPLTEVLDVGKDGFTVEHLTREQAIEHAEAVYSEVNRIKKEGILRTCDMFDAIEHCSLLCVLEQIPELNIFVHQQKGCQRVLSYTCDYCDGVARIPEKTQMTIGGFYKAMTSISKVLEILSTHKKNEKASEEEKANLAILEDVELKKRENKERKKEEKLKISELKNEDSKAEKTPEDTEMTSEAIIAEQSPTVSFSNYKNLKNEIQKVLKASSLFENIPRPLQEDPPRDPEPTVTQAESNNCENCEKLLADLQKIAEENEKLKAEKSQKSPENWQAEKQEMQLKIQELHNENIRIKAENNANLRMIQQLLDKLNKNQ